MRLFIAFPLPPVISTEVERIQREIQRFNPRALVRWTDPSVWHVTLLFLGEVEEGSVSVIKEAIDESLKGELAPLVALNGFVGFPNLLQPQVVGLSLKDITGRAWVIQSNVKRRLLVKKIILDEKKWQPHITLLRVKDRISNLKGLEEISIPELSFTFNQLVLYRSSLTANGPVYQEIVTYSLGQ
ncbi:MAG TPA: RNA 2',3'-cyclic phosphodiesterase [Patescibacteria group bacterium]|nr:RNA 2',3'-cyclic phosphodiesterase [Patescibacteria group bacterium]